MSLDRRIIKERLKEVFDGDTQETIAGKLHISQSGVSKLLSGAQLPTADLLADISSTYNVSVDWLMGKSDVKHIATNNDLSYESAVRAILELRKKHAIESGNENPKEQKFIVKDPLLEYLLKKGMALQDADDLSLKSWLEERLSVFKGKRVLWCGSFDDPDFYIALDEAKDEKDLLYEYQVLCDREDEYAEIMRDD